jgi:O-antigen/teichoic acid export membrane protein
VAAGSVVQILARIGALLCGLVLMGYLTCHLGLGDYGGYALAMVLVNWAGTLIALASGGALIRLVAGHAHGEKFAVAMLQLVGMAGLAAGAVVFAGAEWIAGAMNSPGLAPLLRILAWDLPIGALAGLHIGILTAQGKFLKSAISVLAGWLFQLMAAVVLVGGGMAAQGAAWAVVASGGAQLLTARWMSGVPMFGRERAAFSELWQQSRLIGAAQVALRICQTMDLPAVKYFLGLPAAAGLYAGAQNIGFAGLMLFQPVNPIVQQSLSRSRLEENPAEAELVARTFLRVALIYGGVLAALTVFSGDIAAFLLGAKFRESGPVLALLLIAVAFRIQALAGRTLLSAGGEKASILWPLLGLIVAGLIAYAMVIPQAGILGATAVTVALSLATALLSVRDGLRLLGVRYPWPTFCRVLPAMAITAGVALWIRTLGFHVLIELSLGTALYGILLVVLREIRPTQRHLRFVLDRVNFNDKSKL